MRHWMILCLGLAACGTTSSMGDDDGSNVDCSIVQGVDTFTPMLEHQGVNGNIDFKLISIDPAPQPARGDNTWVVQINSMASGVVGSPMDGATLTVTPFMPSHQHGTPIQVTVQPAGQPGQYTLTPVNLWMPGVWETTINVSSGTTTDHAVYKFCIPS
jgi:hypothetical protein